MGNLGIGSYALMVEDDMIKCNWSSLLSACAKHTHALVRGSEGIIIYFPKKLLKFVLLRLNLELF